MPDNYNNPHSNEILSSINDINDNPQVVYNIKKIADGTTLWENVYLELVNQVLQEGTWATAQVINGIIAKSNAQGELINTLLLLSQLNDNIRSTGNDNLELFGISDFANVGIINNQSDFGILAENAAAGANQIQIIGSGDYRYEKSVSVPQMPNISNSPFLFNRCGHAFNSDGIVFSAYNATYFSDNDLTTNPIFNPDIRSFFVSGNLLIVGTYGTTGHRNVGIAMKSGTRISTSFGENGFYNYSGYVALWDNINKYIYIYSRNSSGTNEIGILYRSQAILLEDYNFITFTTVSSSLTGLAMMDFMIYYSLTSSYAVVKTSTNILLIFDTDYTQASGIMSIPNNFQRLVNNGSVFLALALDGTLYKSVSNVDKIDINQTWDTVDIDFLDNSVICDIVCRDNIFYLSGTNGFIAISTDGINFTQLILINVPSYLNNFSAIEKHNSDLFLFAGNGNDNKGFIKIDSFNTGLYKNKRYVIDNEFVTITDVLSSSDSVILTLQEPLVQNHLDGVLMSRTADSTIPSNSTKTVCVEIDNLYAHNAAVAIPIFTSLENVTVVAEICQRDNETQVETWVPFPLINSLDVKEWRKNTYFTVFETAKMITAIAFTVTNNNSLPVELYQLNIGLSDEIYELVGA